MRRRDVVAALTIGALAAPGAVAARTFQNKDFADLEAQSGGRLGVAILDLQTSRRQGWRTDERFPLCSTFKLLASAAVLARVDKGREELGRRIVFAKDDLVVHSPGTKDHVGEPGMTVAALCEATMTLSDNTAGNLILKTLGGPAGLTAWLRRIGDPVSRLDRWEPALNEGRPGDVRDTTTPNAMLANLHRLGLGNVLTPASRQQLKHWLVANQTGDARLRAGAPQGWIVGDKTGSADGIANDVGIFWPPRRKPILVCAYLTEAGSITPDARNAILAKVGSIAASMA